MQSITNAWQPGDYALSLARVSDAQQTSIPDQHKMITAGAALVGLPVPPDGQYSDVQSRTTGLQGRRDMQALMTRLREPHCRAVIIWDDSRILGDEQQVLDIYPALADNGVRLFTKKGNEIDVSSREGLLIGLIMGWRNKGEVLKTRERVKDTHREKAKGGRLISRPPYGVKAVPLVDAACGGACKGDLTQCDGIRGSLGMDALTRHGELSDKNTVWVIDRIEHERLVFMFKCIAGGDTWGELERRLIARGWLKTIRVIKRSKINVGKEVGGKPFEKSSIRRFIRNPFYKGDFTWSRREVTRVKDPETKQEILSLTPRPIGEWVVHDHRLGALIDPGLWERANRAALLLYKVKEDGQGYPPLLYNGIVFCNRCGWKMYPRKNKYVGKSGVPTFNYYCGSQTSLNYGCTTSHSISEGILDWYVLGLNSPSQGRRVPNIVVEVVTGGETTEAAFGLEAIERALKELDAQEQRAEEWHIRRNKSEAWLDEEITRIDADRAEALAEQERLLLVPARTPMRGSVPEEVLRLARLLRNDALPIADRQHELRGLIDRIVVDRPRIRIVLREQQA